MCVKDNRGTEAITYIGELVATSVDQVQFHYQNLQKSGLNSASVVLARLHCIEINYCVTKTR